MATTPTTLRVQEILGGRTVLGRRVTSQRDWIELVRSGLPHSALESLSSLLKLPAESLSAPLALPKRTLARRKRQTRLTAEESDRLLRLARVTAEAMNVLGTPEKASRWLQKPNRALGNATPLSELDTDIGVRLVEQLLGRIEHGVFS